MLESVHNQMTALMTGRMATKRKISTGRVRRTTLGKPRLAKGRTTKAELSTNIKKEKSQVWFQQLQ